MNREIQDFEAVARNYCGLVESGEIQKKSAVDLSVILQDITRLVMALPQRFDDQESLDISHADWKTMFDSLATLPFTHYQQCFDPHSSSTQEIVIGDLADDIADIWRDLKPGLALYDEGKVDAAVWEWREGYYRHWGWHASSAIYALQQWIVKQYVDEQ